ncbi:MAG: GTPase [Nitrososphaeria archaeon]
MTRKAIILGAAGRDFHNFNVHFRKRKDVKVIAFTAAQIPGISNRIYPPKACGKRYPKGIPIYDEDLLEKLIRERDVDDVYFSYSDISHEHVMHVASRALAAGASFHLLGPKDTMVKARKPVVAVVATRTGSGKSTISRYVASIIKECGKKPIIVRHPMPYGSLEELVQRFEKFDDLIKYNVSVEEMEEYEQHFLENNIVYAGVDYKKILRYAEKEGDIILWDGGNNDTPFYLPDINICVIDPIRAKDIFQSYPGEVNFRAADIFVINKINLVEKSRVEEIEKIIRKEKPNTIISKTVSEAKVDRPELVKGKRVLVIEDGPTITHGGLPEAVGAYVAKEYDAEIVDPRKYAVGNIAKIYMNYPHIGPVLPALGYNASQLKDLEKTISRIECDAIILGTPASLEKIIKINKPIVKVRFFAREIDGEPLREKIIEFVRKIG